jgi:glycosyltransferase involved in cell wall biosynthesis
VSLPRSINIIHLAPPTETTSRKRRGFAGGLTGAVASLVAMQADDLVSVRVSSAREVDLPSDLPTVLHVHHALAWPEAQLLAARLGAPTIYTVHVLQARQSRLRGLDPATPTRSETLEAQALAEATRVTVATDAALAGLLMDHPTLARDKVRLASFAPRLPWLPRAPAAAPTVLAATRFDALKGIDLLVALAARLLTDPRHPDLRFVLAGGLPENARAEARWLDTLRAAVPETAHTRLHLPGWLGPDALAAALASAHVYVSASRIETLGLGLLEALAAGCPAVATDLDVHREVAASARLVPATADALANAILESLEGPAPMPSSPSPSASQADWRAPWIALWRELGASQGSARGCVENP